ncbi:hypothetical protein G6F42_017623 [Rhizopus arrhizus]|nr:hypothetical protein G6F42_017623 [Rhizopus arrhizus]
MMTFSSDMQMLSVMTIRLKRSSQKQQTATETTQAAAIPLKRVAAESSSEDNGDSVNLRSKLKTARKPKKRVKRVDQIIDPPPTASPATLSVVAPTASPTGSSAASPAASPTSSSAAYTSFLIPRLLTRLLIPLWLFVLLLIPPPLHCHLTNIWQYCILRSGLGVIHHSMVMQYPCFPPPLLGLGMSILLSNFAWLKVGVMSSSATKLSNSKTPVKSPTTDFNWRRRTGFFQTNYSARGKLVGEAAAGASGSESNRRGGERKTENIWQLDI